ncbi:unnamed protein product [Trichobilharzia regenti]|nr:unnamed protein product [Trichobilharzia regenti]
MNRPSFSDGTKSTKHFGNTLVEYGEYMTMKLIDACTLVSTSVTSTISYLTILLSPPCISEVQKNQRIKDIQYWKSEVNKKLQDVTEETDVLDEYFIRLKKTLEATEEPLHIAQQCLLSREKRTGIDLVHDDAQKELIKEVEVFKGAQGVLQKAIEQAKEQLRLNRKAIYNLKRDSSDKLEAQRIDEYALSLKPTDESLPGFDRLPKMDAKVYLGENFSTASIEAGDKQLQNSHELRSIIDGVIQQVAADIKRQIEATNRALKKRISETRSSKAKLEEHLSAFSQYNTIH